MFIWWEKICSSLGWKMTKSVWNIFCNNANLSDICNSVFFHLITGICFALNCSWWTIICPTRIPFGDFVTSKWQARRQGIKESSTKLYLVMITLWSIYLDPLNRLQPIWKISMTHSQVQLNHWSANPTILAQFRPDVVFHYGRVSTDCQSLPRSEYTVHAVRTCHDHEEAGVINSKQGGGKWPSSYLFTVGLTLCTIHPSYSTSCFRSGQVRTCSLNSILEG